MDITSLLIFLLIGAIAGWIAGSVMKGKGYGIIGNMVIGIVGAVSADSSSACSELRPAD